MILTQALLRKIATNTSERIKLEKYLAKKHKDGELCHGMHISSRASWHVWCLNAWAGCRQWWIRHDLRVFKTTAQSQCQNRRKSKAMT